MLTVAPIASATELDTTLPLYGLLTTWKVAGPVGAPLGTTTCNVLELPPGSGASGPRLPALENRLTSGPLNPVPPSVTVAPGWITTWAYASGTPGRAGSSAWPSMLSRVGMFAAAAPYRSWLCG